MSKQMMMIVAVIVLILLGGAFFVMNQNQTVVAPETTTPIEITPQMSSEPTGTGSAAQGTVKEFTVTSTGFRFTPATLTVNKGDTVKITYKNGGGTHDWSLDEFKVATKMLNTGEEETVTFVADKAGTYEYYCSVQNHRQMGMKGTLTVL